jgi:hypothetical protein
LRCVDLDVWFPRDRQLGIEYFHTTLHEFFFRAYMETSIVFGPHRVVSVEDIIRVAGEQIHPHLTYLPGLVDLIGKSRKYVQSWIREFYATVLIDPNHDYIEFSFLGVPCRIYSEEA